MTASVVIFLIIISLMTVDNSTIIIYNVIN